MKLVTCVALKKDSRITCCSREGKYYFEEYPLCTQHYTALKKGAGIRVLAHAWKPIPIDMLLWDDVVSCELLKAVNERIKEFDV